MAASLPSRAAKGRRTPIADINVTPLVDVMLVLLIIFMVTAPLMTAGVPVNLPDSRAKALDQAKEPVQLSIEANGLIHLGDQELGEAQLPARLEQLAARGAGQPPQVYLRADRSLDYGRVAKVLGELAHAGLTKVALVSVEGSGRRAGFDAGALMVERAEKAGFGVALVGHAALFALLSLRLLTPPLPVPPPEQAIEVSLAPDVALRQAAPPAPTPPAASEAPEQGPPEEDAVPEPQPAPMPKPAPAKPAPAKPRPAPLKAAEPDKAEADRAAKAAARAAWVEKVQAANAAKADAARVAAEKAEATRAATAAAKAEAHAAWVEKVKAANAAKADAAKAAAAKADAARTAANAARAEAAQAAAARAEQARAAAAAKADAARAAAAEKRAKGSRLGKDFLKGLADVPAKAPSAAAPGATISAKALADIASAIQRQIQPCALRQVNPAPGQAERIRVTLNLKLNRDGSLAAPPRVINHEGLDVDNRRYIDRVDDLAIAAFVGCAPLRGLPGDLYDVPNGWRSISLRFKLPE